MAKSRCFAGGLLAMLAFAAASPPAFAQAPAPTATPAPDAEKTAFLAMPEADRVATQEALGWLGLYNGALDGAYGKRTRDSIVAYQQSLGAAADGVVTSAEFESLKAATQRARAAVDFALVDDLISGVRIGAPLKLLPKWKSSSSDTTLQSADGSIVLALSERTPPKSNAAEDDGLAALYAQLAAETGDRKVTYKALKAGEFFVVAGEEKGKKFYTRFARAPADWPQGPSLRGFTFAFPTERAKDFDKLALAVANSFDPFADTPASHGAAERRSKSARSALDVVRVNANAPLAARPNADASPTPKPAAAPLELTATALLVAPDEALTALPADKCAELAVDGKPAKLLRADSASGLTLIGGDFAAAAEPPTLVVGATDLVALSLAPAANGKSTLEASPGAVASLADGRRAIVVAVAANIGGAPAFDRHGALAAFVAPAATRRVGAVALAEPRVLIGAEEIAAFLQLAPPSQPLQTPTLDAGEIAASARDALAQVVCRP